MNNQDALKIVQALADGVDPITGEVLPDDSPYQSAKVTRALFHCVQLIEHKTKVDSRRTGVPSNAGNPWTQMEDREIVEKFEQGKSVQEISRSHGRTHGAIESRLSKLGKMPPNTGGFRK
ncbi:MAG: hypothetical protein OXU71_00925 [Gammaproteobacteria bacterium]|nr:hypothetical protein [Gammaproteobacteria bacterium]